MSPRAFLVLFLILVPTAALAASEPCDAMSIAVTTTPVPPQNLYSFKTNKTAIDGIRRSADLILIGDSQIDNWRKQQNKDFPNHSIWNFGVGQDRTQTILWRLGQKQIEGLRPNSVVLMIGTNNLSDGVAACSIAAGIQDITERVRHLWPTANIFLFSIPPRGADFLQYDEERKKLNKLIEKYANGKSWVRLVSIRDAEFTCDNYPRPALPSNTLSCFPLSAYPCANYEKDHLHFTSAGYKTLARYLFDAGLTP